MLKKIKRLTAFDIHLLTSFANVDVTKPNGQTDETKYEELLIDSTNNTMDKNGDIQMSVENVIDELMFHDYDIYLKMKDNLKDGFFGETDDYDKSDVNYENFKKADELIKDFIKLYEKLMLETKFEFANIRSIQKFFLQDELAKQIRFENYEFCSELKKRIEQI